MATKNLKEISQADAIKKLGLSRTKLFQLRNDKIIQSWKEGNKVFYSLTELENYLKEKKQKKESKKILKAATTTPKPVNQEKINLKLDLSLRKEELIIKEKEQSLKQGKEKILDSEYEKIEQHLKLALTGMQNIFKKITLSKKDKILLRDEMIKLFKRLR